jgi:bifunctional DNA-binding transcriptional regulator/antitoxin component of YhaV-PrlF toxin-antitoxin module
MKFLKLELTRIGDSLAAVLPDELKNRLNAAKADFVAAVERDEGLLIVPYDAEVEEQVRLGLNFMAGHREIFRALAKR